MLECATNLLRRVAGQAQAAPRNATAGRRRLRPHSRARLGRAATPRRRWTVRESRHLDRALLRPSSPPDHSLPVLVLEDTGGRLRASLSDLAQDRAELQRFEA
jgi:hypothetical protein